MLISRLFSSIAQRSVKPAPHRVVLQRHKGNRMAVVTVRALTFIGCMMALPMPALGSKLQPTESATPAVEAPAPTQQGLAMGVRMGLHALVNNGEGSGSGGGVAAEAFVFATSSLAFGGQAGTMLANLTSLEYCRICTQTVTWAVALGELRASPTTFTPYLRIGGGYAHSVEGYYEEAHDRFAMQVEAGGDFHPRGGFSLRSFVQLFVLPGAEDFPAIGTGVQLGFEPSP